MSAVLAGVILAATLGLVLTRPWDIGEAWWAVLGGGLTLVLGLVSLGQAWDILLETQDALVLLIGMMSLSAVAEKAGFFDWAASITARAGRERVLLLYGFVFLVGTLVTVTLSLDATAIVLTPIVYGMVVRLRLSPMPFMFACVYTANTASLFLPISNLTNLLAYDRFDLGFARFGLVMLLPGVLAILTNFAIFVFLFRNDLRGNYDLGKGARFEAENKGLFRVAAAGIGGVLVAFFAAPLLGIPIGFVALAAGAIVVIVSRAAGWVTLREVVGSVSWGIIFLVVGLFLVVQGVQNAGLSGLVESAFAAAAPGDGFFQILALTFGSAIGANIINNVPMTVLALGTMESLVKGGTLGVSAVYAMVVGTSIGPNLTTVGSLATLIWLSIARGRGLDITAKDYLKIGAIAAPAILLAAAVGLWISVALLGT
ncbi:MAG TPA: ArsB/NhaD family transporter [Rubrobacteraceae bacterium]|nr:ArsB/NhaD family transporter [Rubrobacteraceae bacterium]